ncbi:MAG: hypothetical protein FD138_2479 [Planctomycetota bacterium]|nr:MAG: hypothetical protein FD138_2479 [Planctomycetota bacterium]
MTRNREVRLANLSSHERFGQQSVREVLLRHNHHAAGQPIEPMHDPRPQQASPVRLLIEVMLDDIGQRVRRVVARRVRDLAGRLHDDHDPRILVKHMQRPRSWRQQPVGWLDQPQSDSLIAVHARVVVSQDIVDPHLASTHDPLQPIRRIVAEMPTQKRVNPLAAQKRLDNQFGEERGGHDRSMNDAATSEKGVGWLTVILSPATSLALIWGKSRSVNCFRGEVKSNYGTK